MFSSRRLTFCIYDENQNPTRLIQRNGIIFNIFQTIPQCNLISFPFLYHNKYFILSTEIEMLVSQEEKKCNKSQIPRSVSWWAQCPGLSERLSKANIYKIQNRRLTGIFSTGILQIFQTARIVIGNVL